MYGIYSEIISTGERALDCFDETKELLEYPEVQADKAYYLSVLTKYNNLKVLKDNLSLLISALEEEKAVTVLLFEASTDEERIAIYEEISCLKTKAVNASVLLSDALGCKHINECAYCRFKLKETSSKFGTALFNLIKSDLLAHGATVKDVNTVTGKGGYIQEISFIAEGVDVLTRLTPITGAHKVYIAQSKSEEICFAATHASPYEKISENDLKIDVFHSHGAGGQNINKVETAVRVTHLPTGLSVVCQDERSQLKNKKRALETIEKKLKERTERAEKSRIEATISAQYSNRTSLLFDATDNTMTDTRLKAFSKIKFPLTAEQFTSYINGLISL